MDILTGWRALVSMPWWWWCLTRWYASADDGGAVEHLLDECVAAAGEDSDLFTIHHYPGHEIRWTARSLVD